jgi:uncharacterized membrane protein
MAVLKRIGPGSALKVGLVGYALLGLIVGVLVTLLALVRGPIACPFGSPHSAFCIGVVRHFHGGLALILCPIVYGIIGGICALIGSLIYNLVAGWVGGLEVDIS